MGPQLPLRRLAFFDLRSVMAPGALSMGGAVLIGWPMLSSSKAIRARPSLSVAGTLATLVGFWAVLFEPFFFAGLAISASIAAHAFDLSRVYGDADG